MNEQRGFHRTFIEATDISDAWFQGLHKIIREPVHEYTITRGSYAGQKRREFDFIDIQINHPGHRPLAPIMPEGINIPPPTTDKKIEQNYLLYLLTDEKQPEEEYTYGERLVNPKVIIDGKEFALGINPLEELVKMYNRDGYGTNQATLEIAMPSDILLSDPPCCRIVDTRVRYGALHFFLYFRSWDLFGGLPENLGGYQLVKEHIADRIGVKDGKLFASSKGLHLYDHYWELAEILTQTKKIQ